tara:strand:- start:68 stop:1129 length:1062 start_codon:yes stop_codon:yes gene_type:complete
MGILDDNINDLTNECKIYAKLGLFAVRERAKSLGRNFEEIMNINTDVQSLRLSAFLVGYVGKVVHNSTIPDMIGWWKGAKIDTANRAIQEVMTENGYKACNLEILYEKFHKNHTLLSNTTKDDISFHQGGVIAANLSLKVDIPNFEYNLTIFLDTLEASDGHYAGGVSYKNGVHGNFLSNSNSQPKLKKTLENTKSSIQNDNINDEEFYLTATKEAEGKERNEALWAKCMTISEGDEKKAKYCYINKRVEVLKNKFISEINKQKLELKQEEQDRENEAADKTFAEIVQKERNFQKIRKQEYLKLLKPYPDDKSSNIEQELATENYFPLMRNSNTKLILIKRFKENVSAIMDSQ